MIKNILLIFLTIILFVSCSKKQDKLRVAVAANAQFAIKEIISEFKKNYGIKSELIVGSSGNLTAQIKNGAPYNLFLSADMKYPMDLFNAGFTENKPSVYAYGKLVLWSFMDTIDLDPNILLGNDIKHIAIANPKTAPYGKAAMQALNYFELYEQVIDKLVYGESVSQTNQFITSGASELGFSSYSSIHASKDNWKGNYYIIDQKAYDPIEQGVVILKANYGLKNQAEKFYDFLFTEKAKNIFVKHGYSLNYE